MRTSHLSSLHAAVALNAIGGGIYGLAGARGVPLQWLQGTPFSSYRAPSLILILVVGGAHSAAFVQVVRRAQRARASSLAAGAILLGWIGVQIAMIGFVSWLQPTVAFAALANLWLAATRLPRESEEGRIDGA